ncbi:MAG: hypothetical protein HRT35_38100 [Algicola sp.]|nr:hypothetical protein [Algicola sp.]
MIAEIEKLWQDHATRIEKFDERAITDIKPTNAQLLERKVKGQVDPIFRLAAKMSLNEIIHTLEYVTTYLSGPIEYRLESNSPNAKKLITGEDIVFIRSFIVRIIVVLESCYSNYFIITNNRTGI